MTCIKYYKCFLSNLSIPLVTLGLSQRCIPRSLIDFYFCTKMEIGTSPRVTSSRKRITYKPSGWRVHQFEIWSGELVCRAVALRAAGALLLWLGGGGAADLTEVALGMPAPEDGGGRAALASTLLGAEGAAAALARRLSAALARPVYVCSGLVFDRFTMPLVERGLITEIKSRPECF